VALDPYEVAASHLLDDLPPDVTTDMREWLHKQLEEFDRYVPAATETGRKVVIGITGGRLSILQSHAEGVDTVDWGALRGAQVTTHRKTIEGTGLVDTAYALTHPKLGALVIDLTYLDADQRREIHADLQQFTPSGLPA
jgi:hypothetical protein